MKYIYLLIKLNAGILFEVPSDLEGVVVDFFLNELLEDVVCLQNEVADRVLEGLWLLTEDDVLGVIFGEDVAEESGECSPSLVCGVLADDACLIRKPGSLIACLVLVLLFIEDIVGIFGAECDSVDNDL